MKNANDGEGKEGRGSTNRGQGDGLESTSGDAAEAGGAETEESFRRKVFEGMEDIWGVAAPIAIRGLSIQKGESPSGSEWELPGAPTFTTAVMGTWLSKKLGWMGPPPQTPPKDPDDSDPESSKYVISNVNAVLNPGEWTLIIGPSSSGKTTLMRAIADLCEGRSIDNREGTVLVGGFDPTAPENKRKFNRSTAFADQGDLTLTPVLTVEETVRFSLSCAEAGTVEQTEQAIQSYLRLVGLSHVAGTVVGDADIRGVSGGQKRRVKVLEKAVGQDMRVLFLDEITNGLDAASALSICQTFQEVVEKTGITAMACLLQPSIEVYRTFHRVIILTSKGQVAYSGPRAAALAHFESLGLSKPANMDEPEFFLRCAFKPGEYASQKSTDDGAPNLKSSSDLASLFADSPAGKGLSNELDVAETTDRSSGVEFATVSEYARSTRLQLKYLINRGFKLVMRDPGSFMRLVFIIIFGIFIGTLFLNTPADASGTVTRSGYIFSSLFLIFLTAATAPVEGHFADRGTFYCHRQAKFYSTKSYYLSNMLCSWPVTSLEAALLSVCSFFLVDMESYGGPGFLYFWLIMTLLGLCGCSFSRLMSYGMPSPDVAATIGPAILIVFVLTAGFAPQYPELPDWLRWASWVSPCSYVLEGLLVNELHTRTIAGTDVPGSDFGQVRFAIPRIPYDEATPAMNTPGKLMAFDAYMVLGYTIFVEILGFIVLNRSQKWYGPTTKRYQVTSGMALTAQKDTLSLLSQVSHEKENNDEPGTSLVPPAPLAHLTAENIVYEVDFDVEPEQKNKKDKEETKEDEEGNAEASGTMKVAESTRVDDVDNDERVFLTAKEYGQFRKGAAKEWMLTHTVGDQALSPRGSSLSSSNGASVDPQTAAEEGTLGDLEPAAPGRLRLLSGITASFRPGTMTALMGSSGAGKTTLLDVLAGYKTGGHIKGSISLNGQPKTDKVWRAVAGYCEQTDLHDPAMTVRESLTFAARMRLRPYSLAEEVRTSYCENIIKLLELEEYADMIVGDEGAGQGLPKHARKRLTVGVELSANPSILFADEPSSGLDGLSASLVVSSLQRAAKLRTVTVVCTIHQPSKEVFESFDSLLFLQKGGVVVYNGAISDINNYMTSASGDDIYALNSGANPADHALDIFDGPGGERVDWQKLYTQSAMASEARTLVTSCSCEACQSGGVKIDEEARGVYTELRQVLQRQMLSHWRTPSYMAVRFWWAIVGSLLVALVYMGQEKTTDGAFNIIGAMFSFVNLATGPLMSASVPLITSRAVFYREVSSGTYRKFVYGMAAELAEIPFNLLCALLSWVVFYWSVGLSTEAGRVIYFLLMTLAAYWVLPLFGQVFAFVSPNVVVAQGVGGLLLTIFTLTMGFLIAPSDIPAWWIWIYWINPLRYMLQGMAVNELGGNSYLNEETGESVSGDYLLDAIGGWYFSDRWWYCFTVVLLFGVGATVSLLPATRINWVKR